jgi:tetratricopeptide (TPR) repeat protein
MHSTETLIKQAISLHQQGRLVEAEAAYKTILDVDPNEFDALHMLGIINAQRDSIEEAEKLLRWALAVDSKVPPCLQNYGNILCKLERFAEAIENYNSAIQLAPNHAPLYSDRGHALFALKRVNEALSDYDKALALKPDLADVWLARGSVLSGLKRNDEALHALNKTLALKPDVAEARLIRGNILFDLKRPTEALADFDKALALRPDMASGWLGRGNVFYTLNRNDDALAAYDKALTLNRDFAEVWLGRGHVLFNLRRYDEALTAYDKVLTLKHDLPEAWFGRGNVFFDLNRDDEALQSFGKAIDLRPENAEALLNKSLVKLSLGDFEEGWALYEWRWKSKFFTSPVRRFSQKLWLGDSDIAGKTILVHSEQGFGDIIQFYRYLAELKKLDCKIIFEAAAPLVPLFAAQENNFQIITWGAPHPHFDVHCPILSLPRAFKTTLQTIPTSIPYLVSPPGKLYDWRSKLGSKDKPRVGLAWSGNPRYGKDTRRSIPLELFLPKMSTGIEWHSLQKDVREDDRSSLKSSLAIIDHAACLNDFSDTAALIAELDLVISVDTVVAHLAGALGKPVWILLPFHPDFRWLRGRTDSPWYPTARLFRQTHNDDWGGVIDQVMRELQILFRRAV